MCCRISLKSEVIMAGMPADDREEAVIRSPYTRGVSSKVALWQNQMDQSKQPASSESKWTGPGNMQQLANKDDSYGRPVEGSKTEYRGKQAGVRISGEIIELCKVIQEMGTPQADGTCTIRFGDLFEIYTRISSKLVGMLMRARKQHLIDFEGEMLFQRRDDDVLVRLLQMPDDLEKDVGKMKALLQSHPGNVHAQGHSSFK